MSSPGFKPALLQSSHAACNLKRMFCAAYDATRFLPFTQNALTASQPSRLPFLACRFSASSLPPSFWPSFS